MKTNFELKISLVLARVEILKLKANDHDWQCYVAKDVRESLEGSLIEIDKELKELNSGE